MNSYAQWADIYDAVYAYVRADIPFYMRAADEYGGPVLELGVGTGRVAIPTAAMGVDVVGIDSSEAMLSVARRKASEDLGLRAGRLDLISADMRDFDLRDGDGERRRFPLVTIPFRGFLELVTVEDQVSALRCIRRHLEPGGRLLFNVFVPDPNMALEQSDVMSHLTDVTDPNTGVTHILYQQSGHDSHNQIVDMRMLIETLDDDGVVSRRLYRDYRLRYCHRWELHHLLHMCGFVVEELYGDFDMSPFDADSTEMVWVARKA